MTPADMDALEDDDFAAMLRVMQHEIAEAKRLERQRA
jgi:hypothetical protein